MKSTSDFQSGHVSSVAGDIIRVKTKWNLTDYLGTFMVRMSINRDKYMVSPGLYAVGEPSVSSDVFVTANYKLSFDHLRKNLDGLNAWILVLDTKGINVWCAAGKRTFGTRELVNRINITRLHEVVTHRRIILPQLGATGISAHEVKRLTEAQHQSDKIAAPIHSSISGQTLSSLNLKADTGFRVLYGPVRAGDIKEFIKNNYVSTRAMRKVTFKMKDRVTLIPVDFFQGKYKLLIALLVFLLLSGLNKKGLSFHLAGENGPQAMLNIFLAYVAGIVLMPIALPYIPGHSFSLKGFITGALAFILVWISGHTGNNYFESCSWFLIMTAISSFVAMNFTGSSTFTSLSGVKKEMKVALPLQIVFSVTGLILYMVGKFA